jgi:L-glyceraldehyde 3-phosphate reductase
MNRKRTIAHTDIEVSPIFLGSMTFGNPVASDDAVKIIHWALDHQINFMDTADMYEGYDRQIGSPGGVAESILGQALHDRRGRAVVTTKVGSDVGQGASLDPSYMRTQLVKSLRRLRSDYVDIYMLHRPDPDTPLIQSVGAMAQFISEGKVRHWGFSNFDASQIQEMIQHCDDNNWPRPVINQPPYSWLKRGIAQKQLPMCQEFDIAITPYQPLQGGLLTGKYRRSTPLPEHSRASESSWIAEFDDKMFDKLEQFEAEAASENLTPTRYAIQWLLKQPGVIAVVVGVKGIEQLQGMIG